MTPVPEVLVVDSDVVSYLRLGKDPTGAEWFRTVTRDARLLAISFATYGEVLATGYAAGWGDKRIDGLRSALGLFVVLPFNLAVAEAWAPLHAKVSGHLHRGGANDLWTAACALAQSPPMPVLTNNLRDFDAIARARPDLVVLHPSRQGDQRA